MQMHRTCSFRQSNCDYNNSISKEVIGIPDTGSVYSTISLNLCQELKLTVTPATHMQMKHATGPAFPIYGITPFKISNTNETDPIEVEALIVDGLNHPLLISWLVCVQLKLMHPSFPLVFVDDFCLYHKTNCSFETLNNTSTLKIDIRKLLIKEFPVIHDTLKAAAYVKMEIPVLV